MPDEFSKLLPLEQHSSRVDVCFIDFKSQKVRASFWYKSGRLVDFFLQKVFVYNLSLRISGTILQDLLVDFESDEKLSERRCPSEIPIPLLLKSWGPGECTLTLSPSSWSTSKLILTRESSSCNEIVGFFPKSYYVSKSWVN